MCAVWSESGDRLSSSFGLSICKDGIGMVGARCLQVQKGASSWLDVLDYLVRIGDWWLEKFTMVAWRLWKS